MDKKRYQLTLTISKVAELQRIFKQLGMPQAALSMVIDESFDQMIPMFQLILDRKTSGTQINMFELMAKGFENIEE